MNYRHAFHAGNFADVVKHVALTAILLHLRKKETPFAVIDSHAGRGIYELSSGEAQKTGEAQNGIKRLAGLEGPEALARYLSLVEESGDSYPGSPLIAAKCLRPQDRLVAVEKHPEDAERLKQVLAPFRKARAEQGDGYGRLAALLPPPERRGLVLIDPPFEAEDEFETMARAVVAGLSRFATGIFLIWYPVKSEGPVTRFTGEILTGSSAPALAITAEIAAAEGKLAKAGLLVLNPPYAFDDAMRQSLALIGPRLPGGKAAVTWLRNPG